MEEEIEEGILDGELLLYLQGDYDRVGTYQDGKVLFDDGTIRTYNEEDFRPLGDDMEVCEHCGRAFDVSEMVWDDGYRCYDCYEQECKEYDEAMADLNHDYWSNRL